MQLPRRLHREFDSLDVVPRGRLDRLPRRRPVSVAVRADIDVPSQNSPSPASSFFCTHRIGCRYARTSRASIKDVKALLPPTLLTAIGRVPSDLSRVSWGSGRAPDPALLHFRPPCRAIGRSRSSSRSPRHHGRPRPSSPSTPVLLRWALQNPPPPRARCAGGGGTTTGVGVEPRKPASPTGGRSFQYDVVDPHVRFGRRSGGGDLPVS